MPKIGKNHLIKKPKLVKTTTFATLLIAATLIFSSVAPATTVTNEENVNIENMEPLNAADAAGIYGPEPDEPDMMQALEKTFYYEGSYRGVIVWDNGMDFDTICASQEDTNYGLDSHQADDFMFAQDTKIHGVSWVGGFWNGVTTPSPWGIKIYEDDGTGNSPGDLYAGPFIIDWDDITKVHISGEYWEMTVDIDEVECAAGEKYWIDIWGELDIFPQCGWGAHYYDIIMHMAVWGSDYFGFPYWTDGVVVLGVEFDMAFQLTQKPEHDIAIVEIIEPYDEMELCGCLPVKVSAENVGINDEEDVIVSIDIRNTLYANSFEEPLGFVWETLGCLDCQWNLVPFDTGNPAVVTPRTGNFMAELNSGAGGAGGNCMLVEAIPEDFTGLCNPYLSFYMWHDQLGSEDYIEVWVDPGTGIFQFVAGPFYRICCPGCPTGWLEHKVSLAAFAGLPFVRVGFKGVCDGNPSAYNLHIDDISKFDQEYYAEKTVDIAVGETVEVEFDEEWCPCLWGQAFNVFVDYEVLACAKVDTDQNPGNDCISDTVTLYFPFEIDVAAIEVETPDEPAPGPYELCGTIKNVGQTDQSCFKAKMNVHELGDLEQIWLEEFNYICYPYYEWPPIGWTYDTNNWRRYCYSSRTGSASGRPEIYFYWIPYGFIERSAMTTSAIDATGYFGLVIEFDHYLSHFGGGYTLSVQISTDKVEWTTIKEWVNPTGWGATHETIETSVGAGEVFYLAFVFGPGDPYNLNWWNIDDVKVSGYGLGDSIFYSEVCIEELAVCEEMEVCFPDEFSPPQPWPDCETVKYAVVLSVNPCDPIDQNPANNAKGTLLEIDFYRDVLVAGLSEPCPTTSKNGVMFSQAPYSSSDPWSFYTSSVDLGYLCQDDFDGLTGAVGEIDWWGLSLYWAPGWIDCDPTGTEFEVVFYEPGSTPGAVISVHEVTDYTAEIYDSFSGFTGWAYHTELSPCGNPGQSGWISIQSTYSPNDCNFLWSGSLEGNQNALQNGGPLYDSLAFALYECAGGPPPVDCFIPCGEAPITAVIENAGTHDEVVDVFFELWEFITDPEVGTFVTSDQIDNVAINSGATYNAEFGTYDFAEAGVYAVIVRAPLAGDCAPLNNERTFGIGVDCCPPSSQHIPSPLYPDGENNWYISSVRVDIVATDPLCPDPCLGTASGVKEIHYIIDGGDEEIHEGESTNFRLQDDGVHLVEYWAVDNAGNVEDPFTFEIAIDQTNPIVTMVAVAYQLEDESWEVKFTVDAGEQTSGVNRVEFFIQADLEKVDDEPPYDWIIAWQDDYKTKSFKAVAYDNAGNSGQMIISGAEIAKQITAHYFAQQHIYSKTLSISHNQQPRSR